MVKERVRKAQVTVVTGMEVPEVFGQRLSVRPGVTVEDFRSPDTIGPQIQFMSPREHAPGPRGSPQEPQAPLGDAEAVEPLAETAKTESCRSSLVVWHLGHSAFCLP